MPEKERKEFPEDYWRTGLKKFILRTAEYLQNSPPNTAWIDELQEARAQKLLEILEGIQVMIDNTFPVYGLGVGDGDGEGRT